MEIPWNSWVIVGSPFVLVAGFVVYFLLRRHKEIPSTTHILQEQGRQEPHLT